MKKILFSLIVALMLFLSISLFAAELIKPRHVCNRIIAPYDNTLCACYGRGGNCCWY